MKKISAVILTVILLAALASAAYANYSVDVGETVNIMLYDTGDWYVTVYNYNDWAGNGLYLEVRNNDTELWLAGAPNSPGNYSLCGYIIDSDNNTFYYDLGYLVVRYPEKVASSCDITGKAGEWLSYDFEDLSSGGEISDVSCQGSVPDGMNVDWYDSYACLSGTPQKEGVFTFLLRAFDDHSSSYVSKEVTVNVKSGVNWQAKVTPASAGFYQGVPSEAVIFTLDSGYGILHVGSITGVPDGMTAVAESGSRTVKLTGTPTKDGTFTVNAIMAIAPLKSATQGNVNVSTTVTVQKLPFMVTREPTGEAVIEGQNAWFISGAQNYSAYEWRIVSADGSQVYNGKSAIESHFPGVQYKDWQQDGDEYLALNNIPFSMDGYYVQTMFWSLDKTEVAVTNAKAAKISVTKAELKEPVIKEQPKGGQVKAGEKIVLSVKATSPEGKMLKYEWYKNGQKIPGATGADYTPEEFEGSAEFNVLVFCTDGERSSKPVTSDTVKVEYLAKEEEKKEEAEPSPSPETTVSPAVTSTLPTPTPEPAKKSSRSGGMTAFIIILFALALLLAAGAYIYIRKSKEKEEQEEQTQDRFDKDWDDKE